MHQVGLLNLHSVPLLFTVEYEIISISPHVSESDSCKVRVQVTTTEDCCSV